MGGIVKRGGTQARSRYQLGIVEAGPSTVHRRTGSTNGRWRSTTRDRLKRALDAAEERVRDLKRAIGRLEWHEDDDEDSDSEDEDED